MVWQRDIFYLFLYRPHRIFVSPENLCVNIECLHVQAKFYLIFKTFLNYVFLCSLSNRFICTYYAETPPSIWFIH
jgi:hypothetical protein